MTPPPIFSIPVAGFVPGKPADGLKVFFKHKTRKEYNDWTDSFSGEPLAERMAEVIERWEDAPCDYSPEALMALSDDYPAFAQALFQSYGTALFGVAQKN